MAPLEKDQRSFLQLKSNLPVEKMMGRKIDNVNVIQANLELTVLEMKKVFEVDGTTINTFVHEMNRIYPASAAYRAWRGDYGEERFHQVMKQMKEKKMYPSKINSGEAADDFLGRLTWVMVVKQGLKEEAEKGNVPDRKKVNEIMANIKPKETVVKTVTIPEKRTIKPPPLPSLNGPPPLPFEEKKVLPRMAVLTVPKIEKKEELPRKVELKEKYEFRGPVWLKRVKQLEPILNEINMFTTEATTAASVVCMSLGIKEVEKMRNVVNDILQSPDIMSNNKALFLLREVMKRIGDRAYVLGDIDMDDSPKNEELSSRGEHSIHGGKKIIKDKEVVVLVENTKAIYGETVVNLLDRDDVIIGGKFESEEGNFIIALETLASNTYFLDPKNGVVFKVNQNNNSFNGEAIVFAEVNDQPNKAI